MDSLGNGSPRHSPVGSGEAQLGLEREKSKTPDLDHPKVRVVTHMESGRSRADSKADEGAQPLKDRSVVVHSTPSTLQAPEALALDFDIPPPPPEADEEIPPPPEDLPDSSHSSKPQSDTKRERKTSADREVKSDADRLPESSLGAGSDHTRGGISSNSGLQPAPPKTALDQKYIAFRTASRMGFIPLAQAAKRLALDPRLDVITGRKQFENLLQTVQSFYSTYVDSEGIAASPLPSEMQAKLLSLLGAITQFSLTHQLAIKESDKPTLLAHFQGIRAIASDIRQYAIQQTKDETIRSNYEATQRNDITRSHADLHSILEDPRQSSRLVKLREACRKEFCEENLDFLLSVCTARALPAESKVAKLEQIRTQFIAADASQLINISDQLKQEVTAALEHLRDATTPTAQTTSESRAAALVAAQNAIDKTYDQIFGLLRDGAYMRMKS